jgi:hypothetical protein
MHQSPFGDVTQEAIIRIWLQVTHRHRRWGFPNGVGYIPKRVAEFFKINSQKNQITPL